MPQPTVSSAQLRFSPIHVAALLLVVCVAVFPGSLDAQSQMFLIGPYGGLPLSNVGVEPAIGMHVQWSATETLDVAARYEWRMNESRPDYGCVSLDAVRRLAGKDDIALALTGGWARWQNRDRAAMGLRFWGPLATTGSGRGARVELWMDVRYAVRSLDDVAHLSGKVWGAVMFVVPLNMVVGF